MDASAITIKNLKESIELKTQISSDESMIQSITELSMLIVEAYRVGKKVLFCGNGGSAADAQHLAAELSGRYYLDRPPLFAEALHVNTSFLTAVSNDYSFADAYARLVAGTGKTGDILIGMSTSGNSENIIRAMQEAKRLEMITVGFTGQGGGKLKQYCDFIFEIPSINTPRIQECHMLIGHSICEIVEEALFGQEVKEGAYLFPNIDPSWTLFLDRDGVINERLPEDYVKTVSEFKFLPGVVESIAAFSKIVGKIIVVTNQQGISKGLMTKTDLEAIHQFFKNEIHQHGGRIDAIYVAPQLASENSIMRKPAIGMALQAQQDFPEIDFEKSIMVGDTLSDMEFGKRAGMKTIWIGTSATAPKGSVAMSSLAELKALLLKN